MACARAAGVLYRMLRLLQLQMLTHCLTRRGNCKSVQIFDLLTSEVQLVYKAHDMELATIAAIDDAP
jgi:hypothetical protein